MGCAEDLQAKAAPYGARGASLEKQCVQHSMLLRVLLRASRIARVGPHQSPFPVQSIIPLLYKDSSRHSVDVVNREKKKKKKKKRSFKFWHLEQSS